MQKTSCLTIEIITIVLSFATVGAIVGAASRGDGPAFRKAPNEGSLYIIKAYDGNKTMLETTDHT